MRYLPPPRQMFQIQERPPGFPTTNLTNELARAVNACQPYIHTGQLDEPIPGGAATLPTGQYQWQIFQMVSANQTGFDDARATAFLEDV